MTDTTLDAFMDGRIRLCQPATGYRAGTDPVFLAAATPARPGDMVLELGCGAGAVLCCLMLRVPGLKTTGVELQPSYAALARRNVALNGLRAEIITADLRTMPATLQARQFDHVIANPPYFDNARHAAPKDSGKAAAVAADMPLAIWVDAALCRLRPGGRITMIHKVGRLPELLAGLGDRAGAVHCLPIAPRQGCRADRVLIHARKAARGAFQLCAPLIVHCGTAHDRGQQKYRPGINAVLRDGAALECPWMTGY